MGYGVFAQIILVIVSVVVIFTFVQPKFMSLRSLQDEVARYTEAVDKAGQFNARLSELLQKASSFSQRDIRLLETFLPKEIDEVAVARDLKTIAKLNNVEIISVEGGEVMTQNQSDAEGQTNTVEKKSAVQTEALKQLVTQDFTVAVTGSYTQFKSFLRALEKNAYPLTINELNFSEKDETGQYSFSLNLSAYAFNSQ